MLAVCVFAYWCANTYKRTPIKQKKKNFRLDSIGRRFASTCNASPIYFLNIKQSNRCHKQYTHMYILKRQTYKKYFVETEIQ